MSQTTVNLGYVPKNRGEYSSTASYYKDNIVQYNGSSYICNPPNYDPDTASTASITGVAPYASDPAVPNTGWAVFANDASGMGEGVYNVSEDHIIDSKLKVYETLSQALADVPLAKQKGGMSIKFVQGTAQSSDNKYVQYRLIAQNFTTDVTQWAISDESVYVENPEYVYVKTDAEGKILWGIKADGDIFFGAGVPSQIQDYVEQKISEASPENYEQVLAFLDGMLGTDTNLKAILESLDITIASKVDKIEGKSLINSDFASTQESIENPEYFQVTTDSDSKILQGIKSDGTSYIGSSQVVEGDLTVNGNINTPMSQIGTIDNPEYLNVELDEQGKVLSGTKKDGSHYIYNVQSESIDALREEMSDKVSKEEGKGLSTNDYTNEDKELVAVHEIVDNPEYIKAEVDAEGKLLAGRTPDGAAFENVGFSTPKVSIDGATLSNIEDPEGRSEIITDSEDKIISYRDADGVKHEEVGVSTNNLILTDEGLTDLEKDLKAHGFSSDQGDWSDSKELHIAEPYCARVNFTGIDDIPQAKFLNVHGIMQVWDMNGNYFKKEVIMNAQGRSTMGHPKKNIAIDICNNNGWDDSDTFSLQIGDWVPQDSFHLKAFYNDPFRCLCPVAYKLNDEILKTRGEHNDYVWKRALFNLEDITPTSTGCENYEDAIDEWNTNARCFPMGFPCIVYLNGEFYGIYSWQLKKHRDNYQMSKKKTKHIHLDGIISLDRILNANGDPSKIWWTTDSPEGVEIRNPKPKKKKDGWDLVLLNGEKYDADANGGEIMSPTMIVEGEEIANPNWDSTNESHVKSYEVKQYILNMSKIIPTLADAYNTYDESAKTSEDKTAFKEVFETYFDVDNLIDYLILSDVLANYDGFSQNVQWITYNGIKWYLCAYDLDGVMGNWWQLNDTIVAPVNTHYSFAQFRYIPIFYNVELEARYKELRDMEIISVSNIINLVEYWLKRIGAKETFEKEWEKWPNFIKNDNVHRLYKWLQISISNMDILYNYNQI